MEKVFIDRPRPVPLGSREIGGAVKNTRWRAVVGVGTFLVVCAEAAAASNITVNTAADSAIAGDGLCTLREAIANVNAATDTTSGDCPAGSGTGDTVTFALALPAQIKLAAGTLFVEHDVDIVGPAVGGLRISGALKATVLRIAPGATCSMSSLIIEQGKADFGGGIRNGGTLNMTNCTVRKNGGAEGAGIFNEGTATLTGCTVASNRAGSRTSGSGGGGIANNGTLTLTDSRLSGNSGGQGGGAISNGGMLALTRCTLDGNIGGQGGALNNSGSATLTNCTLTGNRSRYGVGGGVLNIGTATLTSCTLERNTAFAVGGLGGGGIWHFNNNGTTITLTSTIVAHGGRGRDCGGDPVVSAGHNLDSDGSCFAGGGSDLVGVDPALTRLADYGGPTKTIALCTAAHAPSISCRGASPALDAGDDGVIDPPLGLTTDQRGLARKSGTHVDIGAYEAQ
jgi:CSLREA domain-containing protein